MRPKITSEPRLCCTARAQHVAISDLCLQPEEVQRAYVHPASSARRPDRLQRLAQEVIGKSEDQPRHGCTRPYGTMPYSTMVPALSGLEDLGRRRILPVEVTELTCSEASVFNKHSNHYERARNWKTLRPQALASVVTGAESACPSPFAESSSAARMKTVPSPSVMPWPASCSSVSSCHRSSGV